MRMRPKTLQEWYAENMQTQLHLQTNTEKYQNNGAEYKKISTQDYRHSALKQQKPGMPDGLKPENIIRTLANKRRKNNNGTLAKIRQAIQHRIKTLGILIPPRQCHMQKTKIPHSWKQYTKSHQIDTYKLYNLLASI